jgi:nitroreductase
VGIKNKIYDIIENNSKKLDMAGRIVLNPTKMAIKNSKFLILVYNTGDFIKFTSRFNRVYSKATRISEISAISATIQNMILTAASLGIGSCWLDTPLLYEKKINKIIKIDSKDELVAILTFGYPSEKGKRAPRKPVSKTVKFIE